MAFNTAQALLTTVTSDVNLAYASLGVLYGVFTLAAVVAPRVVDALGPKLAMALGAVPYVLMVFANMAPSWYTLVPASAGVGAGAAVLWTGQGIYLSRAAIREAAATGEPVDGATSRMNGLFWTAFQFNAAVGLVASSLLLESASPASLAKVVKYMFAGFGALGAGGVLILASLRPAPPLAGGEGSGAEDGEGGGGGGGAPAAADKKEPVSLVATLRLMVSSRAMALLLPIIFYNGVSLGFINGSFPLLYADASDAAPRLLPKASVGYVAATFYLVNAGASFAWGRFVIPRLGRRPLFLLTAATHAAFYLLALGLAGGRVSGGGNNAGAWVSVPHGGAGAYALALGGAVLFALGDSVLESQLPSIIQSPSFFPAERDRDAANSGLRMAQSLGFAAQFGVSIAAGPLVQAAYCAGLAAAGLACLWACDAFVRPVDAPGGPGGKGDALGDPREGGYAAVQAGEDD